MKKKIENAKQLGKKRLKHPPIWHSSAEVPETNEMVLTVLKKGDGIIDRFLNDGYFAEYSLSFWKYQNIEINTTHIERWIYLKDFMRSKRR